MIFIGIFEKHLKKVRKMVEKTEYHHEQTVNKQANITCAAAEDVDGKEERIIRN